MVARLLSREWSYGQFERAFGVYYYEHVPVDVMRSQAGALYSEAIEKLEFTMAAPSAADREEGWIAPEEYISWLEAEFARRAKSRD